MWCAGAIHRVVPCRQAEQQAVDRSTRTRTRQHLEAELLLIFQGRVVGILASTHPQRRQ
jgi:hypothetical protein